jgi:hypothetical protein
MVRDIGTTVGPEGQTAKIAQHDNHFNIFIAVFYFENRVFATLSLGI